MRRDFKKEERDRLGRTSRRPYLLSVLQGIKTVGESTICRQEYGLSRPLKNRPSSVAAEVTRRISKANSRLFSASSRRRLLF